MAPAQIHLRQDFGILTACCLIVIVALLVVGAVSHGVIRHIVQTSPLWIAIALGFRHSGWSKWAALPCFVFWLLLMSLIWLFLLGWARIVTGTYSPTEIAMTVIVGLASAVGIVTALRTQTELRVWLATVTVVMIAALQIIAIRISLLAQIAHR